MFRRFFGFLFALAVAATVCLGIYVMNACKLREIKGERVFYLDSDSSQALRKTELSLKDYARITGESVRFARGEENAEESETPEKGKGFEVPDYLKDAEDIFKIE